MMCELSSLKNPDMLISQIHEDRELKMALFYGSLGSIFFCCLYNFKGMLLGTRKIALVQQTLFLSNISRACDIVYNPFC